jgi:hypothetical protein
LRLSQNSAEDDLYTPAMRAPQGEREEAFGGRLNRTTAIMLAAANTDHRSLRRQGGEKPLNSLLSRSQPGSSKCETMEAYAA